MAPAPPSAAPTSSSSRRARPQERTASRSATRPPDSRSAALGALAIGLALGFLGSGGSILAVPVLIYLLGQEEKVAIAGSLAVVGAVAAAGAVDAARRGAVAWRAVALFGGAGFVGSAIGALLRATRVRTG